MIGGGLLGPFRAGSDPPKHIGALADSAKRLLLQLDSDSESGTQCGDAGMLCFWVTERGLGEEAHDDVWMVLQPT